jgi:hypothetical protein
MAVEKHPHKLKRHTYKTGATIYFCVSDCSFRIQTELALGKIAECWRCGKAFPMNSYSITLAKPHCEDCHNHKGEPPKARTPLNQVAVLAGDEIVESLSERLHSLTAKGIEIKQQTETIKTSEIKEFKLEEEDLI